MLKQILPHATKERRRALAGRLDLLVGRVLAEVREVAFAESLVGRQL